MQKRRAIALSDYIGRTDSLVFDFEFSISKGQLLFARSVGMKGIFLDPAGGIENRSAFVGLFLDFRIHTKQIDCVHPCSFGNFIEPQKDCTCAPADVIKCQKRTARDIQNKRFSNGRIKRYCL
jgi:hypothetical protein